MQAELASVIAQMALAFACNGDTGLATGAVDRDTDGDLVPLVWRFSVPKPSEGFLEALPSTHRVRADGRGIEKRPKGETVPCDTPPMKRAQ